MKKILFLVLCCSVFVLGCGDISNDIDEISFDEAINEEIDNSDNNNINKNNVQQEQNISDGIIQALKEGMNQREAGNLEAALNVYTNALKEFGDSASLYADRGRIKREIGDTEGSLEDVNKALELSQEAWIYAERGVIYKMRNENELALQDFKKALSMDSNMQWIADSIRELENIKE